MSIRRPNGNGARDRITVPCGKCPACLGNKRVNWALRMREELKVSKSAKFITLTYNDDKNTGSVSKIDVQLFLKRFRALCFKVEVDLKLRYYITGEYGLKGHRPHYHAIMYNTPNVNEMELYEMIGKAWKNGHSFIGTVTDRSIMYVAKYLLKGSIIPEGCEEPFSLMSSRPGIGSTYIERMSDWHHADLERSYVPKDGYKLGMPRYWKDKIYCRNTIEKQKEEFLKLDKEKFEELIRGNANYWENEFNFEKDLYRKLELINNRKKL